MKKLFIFLLYLLPIITFGQYYTSYFTGNTIDTVTNPTGGVCLMGGATENDNAMIWFLNHCDGGDVLVIRASGSDGYNDYLYQELNVTINSVESIVFNDAQASLDPYIQQKITQAEGIWIAGGDQWDYVSYWRNTAIDSLINDAILNRNIVIGGTSAGMAVLGGFYFSAENGTVTSAEALANPYNTRVRVDSSAFLKVPYLHDINTDTHYDNPDRRGRQAVFLARIMTDYGIKAKGIACGEYTAVCIPPDGNALVYGSSNHKAYFIQTNCELPDRSPETCTSGIPLTWNRNMLALKVYRITGTNSGTNTFNLNDWETGSGGHWENWYINNGTLFVSPGEKINCSGLGVTETEMENEISIYPNPTEDKLFIQNSKYLSETFEVFDSMGKPMKLSGSLDFTAFSLDVSKLKSGMYYLKILTSDQKIKYRKFIILDVK